MSVKVVRVLSLMLGTLFCTGCFFVATHKKVQQEKLQILWQKQIIPATSVSQDLRPAFSEKAIFVAEKAGIVKKIKAHNGKVLWEKKLSGTLTGALTYFNGHLYIPTNGGKLLCWRADTGQPIWKVRVYGSVPSAPAVDKENVAVRTLNNKLVVLDTKTGAKRWDFTGEAPPLSLNETAAPVLEKDMVIAGFADGKVRAFRRQDGQLLWEQAVGQPVGWSDVARLVDIQQVSVDRERVYAVSYQGSVAALDKKRGQILWRRPIAGLSGFSRYQNQLALADRQRKVWVLEAATGHTLWQHVLSGHRLGAPSYYHHRLVLGDDDGQLFWLNTDDGRVLSTTLLLLGALSHRGQVIGERFFVGSDTGQIAALQLK